MIAAVKRIPVSDPGRGALRIARELRSVLDGVLASGRYVMGPSTTRSRTSSPRSSASGTASASRAAPTRSSWRCSASAARPATRSSSPRTAAATPRPPRASSGCACASPTSTRSRSASRARPLEPALTPRDEGRRRRRTSTACVADDRGDRRLCARPRDRARRGLRPGGRRPPQRPPRRRVRRRRRVQLLPDEEPRRARRRRRGRDVERRDRRARAPPAPVRLGPQVRGRRSPAAATRGSTSCRPRCCASASGTSTRGTRARRSIVAPLRRGARRRAPAASCARDGEDYVAHLAVLVAEDRERVARRARPRRDRDRRPLPDPRPPPAGLARRLRRTCACRSPSTRASTC